MHDVHRQARALRSPSSLGRIAVAAPFHDEGYGYDVFGLHPRTLERMLTLGAPIYDRYFRVASEGIAHVPTRGAAILVANHGGALPVDAAMLCFDVLRRLAPPRIPRAITDRFVPHLPVIGTLFARCGAVSGTRRNATHLLERGELLAIWPEGVSGPAKRFRDRYRLQSWNPGFAELAIRHQAAIVPVAILGAEESWPLLGKLDLHWFGSPYLPVGAWPLPLPAHYHIRYGDPVELCRDYAPEAADSPALVAEAATRVRTILEHQIEDLRMIRRGVFR